MAQGAAMAVEDVLVLVEELEAADSIESALSAFERRRRPRVALVQARSSEYARGNLRYGITTEMRAAFFAAASTAQLAERWQDLIAEPP